MKYFFDTEFIEDGKTIDLISIGIVSENGKEYYAHSADYNPNKAGLWVQKNVFPYVKEMPRIPKEDIAQGILDFIGEDSPEFWAWYASYDWIVICQLFGTMMDLPKGWPMYCMDVKQLCKMVGDPDLTLAVNNENSHDALADAHMCKQMYEYLMSHYEIIVKRR